MSKVLLALTTAAVLGLAGCATQPETGSAAATATKGAISADAQAALAKAQADVKMAKEKNALWTTAETAVKAAEAAAEKGDSETVIKQSKLASEHVKLGIAQLDYPRIKVGD